MSPVQSPAVTRPSRSTSLPIVIGVFIVGIAVYFVVPRIMTQVMYRQEKAMADAKQKAYFQEKAKADALFLNGNSEIGPNGEPVNGGNGVAGAGSPAMGNMPNRRGGGGQGGGGQGGGNFDPEELFKRRDADNDGKLVGAEISPRLQARLDEIDKDKDGAISKEEYLASMPARGGATPPTNDSSNQPAEGVKPAATTDGTEKPSDAKN